jgi:hypothetical protein
MSACLLRQLGPARRGEFVAIESRTARPTLGKTALAAVEAGMRDRPRGVLFIERLGYTVAGTMKQANDARTAR